MGKLEPLAKCCWVVLARTFTLTPAPRFLALSAFTSHSATMPLPSVSVAAPTSRRPKKITIRIVDAGYVLTRFGNNFTGGNNAKATSASRLVPSSGSNANRFSRRKRQLLALAPGLSCSRRRQEQAGCP